MKTIAVIDDDIHIGNILEELLQREGYAVLRAYSGTEAVLLLERQQPDLVLLDLMLPGLSGEEVLSKISGVPTIVVSAKAGTDDKVKLLLKGAADYVTKPFELDVLLLRISALLRRTGDVSGQYLSCDSIALDQKRMLVFCDTEEICLSPLEYQVLFYLLRHKGKTVTRRKLLEEIWDINGNYVNDNTLTVTIKRLREKLHQPLCLKTVRSVGYRMEDSK